VWGTVCKELLGLPRRRTIGSEQTVADMTREDLSAWHREHYVSGNVLVVVVSQHQAEDAFDLVPKCFRDLPTGRAASRQPALPKPSVRTTDLRIRKRDPTVLDRVWLKYGYAFVGQDTGRGLALRWVVKDLAEREFAEEWDQLRCPTSFVATNVLGQAVVLYAQLWKNDGRWWWLRDRAAELFGRLREGETSPQELAAAKARVQGRVRSWLSTNHAIADFAVTAPPELLSGALLRALDAIGLKDIHQFCADNFVKQKQFSVLSVPILTVVGTIRCVAGLGTFLMICVAMVVWRKVRRRTDASVHERDAGLLAGVKTWPVVLGGLTGLLLSSGVMAGHWACFAFWRAVSQDGELSPGASPGLWESPAWLVAISVGGTLSIVAGGYVAGRTAEQHPARHGALTGIALLAFATFCHTFPGVPWPWFSDLAAFLFAPALVAPVSLLDGTPCALCYEVVAVIAMLPAAAFGGMLAQRRNQVSATCSRSIL